MRKPEIPARKATEVMNDIQAVVGSIDGIATSDVFKLAGLIREYGERASGEAVSAVIAPLMEGLTEKFKGPTDPWKSDM